MLKIRLARHGVKNKPFFKIVVIDSKNKNKGMPLENIGFWQPDKADPRAKLFSKGNKKIDKDRLNFWVSKGASVSEAVNKLVAQN